ncbi:YgfZ/GcvT domain-containing protein [Marinobacter koreensis]|uniref:YgfZ/GcvT domain-containing protein n=1 Tax=Marinobacter koreensis TaxID=335974 RepID=A0ABW0RMA8_9GAMM|nr:folate-binding protein [Marinobacter koreensis]MCK7549326.1 folate-binding protein [Marinobacter koreensis]
MTDSETAPETASLPRPESGYCRLTHRMLVRISGPGTDKFLQGQFSQNLDDVTADRALRAAACTPKGRTYCLTRLARAGQDVLMDLPTDLSESILTQLRKYLMLFRGTSMDAVQEGVVWGIIGSGIAETLAGSDLSKLQTPGDALSLDTGILIRLEPDDRATPRYQFWQLGSEQPDWDDAPELTRADWRASEIAAGIPELDASSQEAYVPQMLNWQHLGGIHFKKGCYTGQEVIARMHFLGQLKKSLFRVATDNPVSVGAAITGGDRNAGDIISQVVFENGQAEQLAVIRHDATSGPLTVDGQTLEILPLPYSVPERESASDT